MSDLDPDELSLVIDSNRVPVSQLMQAADSFVSIVRRVSSEATGAAKIELYAQFMSGSQVLALSPGPQADIDAVRTSFGVILSGLRDLGNPGTTEMPRGFDESSLADARRLAALAARGLGPVSIVRAGVAANLNTSTIGVIDRLRSFGYQMEGSVEGRLDAVNIHDELRCTIYREFDGKGIRAEFEEQLFDSIRSHLGQRISAMGTVYYDLAHRIKRIKVSNVRRLHEDTEVPSIRQVAGILGG